MDLLTQTTNNSSTDSGHVVMYNKYIHNRFQYFRFYFYTSIVYLLLLFFPSILILLAKASATEFVHL